MNDAAILKEIEDLLKEYEDGNGWFEEKAGFDEIRRLIYDLRKNKPKIITIREFDD